MKKIAISVGDINGVGIQIAFQSHSIIKTMCDPIYCIDKKTLKTAAKLLDIKIPHDFNISGKYTTSSINPGVVKKDSGRYSYESFLKAIDLAKTKKVDAICTLPINKKAWEKAGLSYVGHTDMLRDIFKEDAIMMLGCDELFVALFTEHIPLKDVPKYIKTKKLHKFFQDFYKSIGKPKERIGVLALNPHAGDGGVLGNEEKKIIKAIKNINKLLKNDIFELLVPDVAFAPHTIKNYKYIIAMYHDQGLAPLKALYFDKSINVSLNLPIIRTSVDHGTAFDIAYKNKNVSNLSYINAINEAVLLGKPQK